MNLREMREVLREIGGPKRWALMMFVGARLERWAFGRHDRLAEVGDYLATQGSIHLTVARYRERERARIGRKKR